MPATFRRALASLLLAAGAAGCGGGGSTTPPPPRLPAPATSSAAYDPAEVTSTAVCPGGTQACGASAFCCPTGTACVANPNDMYGCGSDVCCVGCAGGGLACGGGCCASGSSCVANPGGATGCGGNLCCGATPDPDPCPANVAATCPGGTRCLKNKSARFCAGGYACYQPTGAVACPGEVMCEDQASFCPSGTYCGTTAGVCPVGSAGAGNYCCFTYAGHAQSCDDRLCAPGLGCVTNPHCGSSDPDALKTCKSPCGTGVNADFPNDCGNYCCGAGYPICSSSPDPCMCFGVISTLTRGRRGTAAARRPRGSPRGPRARGASPRRAPSGRGTSR